MSATDFELLQAWRGGDRQAGSQLFDRHFEVVARFFANKVALGLDDLVQQTFLGCIEARDRFRGDAQFRTFLLRIARNVLSKHYREKRGPRGSVDFGVTSVEDLAPSASVVLARHAEQRVLLEALRRIPIEHQIVLELTYWERLTAVQISEILEIPEGTAKTRLRRARQSLSEAIHRLEGDPQRLQSTIGNLDHWARSLGALARAKDSDGAG